MSAASNKLHNLKVRAELLKRARAFFDERQILEMDCPMLLQAASIDAHIDLISCPTENQIRYLHTSPEYCMKRLLAMGMGDIYQLGHVFRAFEYGRRHNPEFTMAEWYRVGFSFEQMMQETCEFISLFVGDLPVIVKSYQELFLEYVDLDPFTASLEALLLWIAKQGHTPPYNPETDSKDDLLAYILATFIEPHLGRGVITCVPYFPKSQAALAKVKDENVAERFEVFHEGIELANGYHELQDAKEQRKRFIESNALREKMGKESLTIDERFLQALEKGFSDCCGVAVGFDRLVMLHLKAESLEEVLPFSWVDA